MTKRKSKNNVSAEELRKLSAYLTKIHEEEIERISKDLHDELGQKLTAVQLEIGVLLRKLQKNKFKAEYNSTLEKYLQNINNLVDDTIKSTKRLVKSMRPELLDELGLIGAIEWFVNDYQPLNKIQCEFITNADDSDFSKEIALTVYRIVQEALNNILKHAEAEKVLINLRMKRKNFELEIIDDGVGLSSKKISIKNGLGLIGIRERVHSHGGKFNIFSNPSEGTVLKIELPAMDGKN